MTPPRVPPAWRPDLLAGLACAAVGLALAAAPNLAALWRHGTPVFLADFDETYYLGIARAPYYGELHLRDPYLPSSRGVPTLHTWLMFAPWAWLCRGLGLPLVALGVVWRVVGGAALGASLYALSRKLMGGTSRPVAWALGVAVVCLADAGFCDGRTLFAGFGLLWHLLAGTCPLPKPDSVPQYRVVTPLLNLPVFLLLMAVVSSPRARGRWGVVVGSVLLAACIYLYFFFWTTAVLALGLYAAANFALAAHGPEADRARRRDAGRFAAAVLVGGLVLGAPQVLGTTSTGTDPGLRSILERIAKGYHLPPGSPSRVLNVRNSWVWTKLGLGALGVLALGTRRVGLLWCATLCGYALANSALLTGLEFENFHWSYCYDATGELLALAVLGQWLDRAARGRPWVLRSVALVPAGVLALALVWRPVEALRAPEPSRLAAALEDLKPLRPALGRLGPEFVLAGERTEVSVALLLSRCSLLNHSLHFPSLELIPDREVHERDALDAWLRGLDLAAYERQATLTRYGLADPGDPRWPLDAIRRERVGYFRALERGDTTLLTRYPVDGLLRRTPDGPPPRGGSWSRLAGDATWTLWVRPPARAPERPSSGV
jgi:hypothetical protein